MSLRSKFPENYKFVSPLCRNVILSDSLASSYTNLFYTGGIWITRGRLTNRNPEIPPGAMLVGFSPEASRGATYNIFPDGISPGQLLLFPARGEAFPLFVVTLSRGTFALTWQSAANGQAAETSRGVGLSFKSNFTVRAAAKRSGSRRSRKKRCNSR